MPKFSNGQPGQLRGKGRGKGRRKSKSVNVPNHQSLCWFCKKSRPSSCAWIGEKEKIYSEGVEITYNAGGGTPSPVILVKKCNNFEFMEKLRN